MMKGFVQGVDRQQATLLPEYLDDWVDESNPVRAVDVFVDALELRDLGFGGVDPAATGRPGYHPSAMLKLYIFGYLNQVQSSRRLEREAGRNLEVMWLTGRLVPDHKTIADFRDTTNHLIVAHEVTNVGTDKSHFANMANQAKAALEAENLEAFADRGYFKGEEMLCKQVRQGDDHLRSALRANAPSAGSPQMGFDHTSYGIIRRRSWISSRMGIQEAGRLFRHSARVADRLRAFLSLRGGDLFKGKSKLASSARKQRSSSY
jgi:transposase